MGSILTGSLFKNSSAVGSHDSKGQEHQSVSGLPSADPYFMGGII